MRIFMFACLLLCQWALSPWAWCQVTVSGTPWSQRHSVLTQDLPIVFLPEMDNDSLDAIYNENDDMAYTSNTFGVVMPADIGWNNAGRWDTLANGNKIWRLKIYSKSAKGFRIICDQYQLPDGASLYAYDTTGLRLYGAYTSHNNKGHGKFETGVLPGEELTLEYNLPSEIEDPGIFHVNGISYAFLDYMAIGDAASCQNDVNCLPWVNEWCNEIRAVVRIRYNSVVLGDTVENFGSGVLINNTNEDFTPYILTASHIAIGTSSKPSVKPETWTIYYNFQAPTCSLNNIGNDQMTTSGVNVVTNSSSDCPDIALLESTVDIPLGYNIYFAGWNRRKRNDWPSNDVTTIHHPKADLKKVSEGVASGRQTANCIQVKYNSGIIESGSSGAPSFDTDHRIVAIQSQRNQTCDDNSTEALQGNLHIAHLTGFDWYGYLGGGDFLDGIDPVGACQDNLTIHGILYPGNDWQAKNEILVQAGQSISTWPNTSLETTIKKSSIMSAPNDKADYTFRAGQSIKLLPGFKVEHENRFLAEIGSCESFDDCGFNFEAVPNQVMNAVPALLHTPNPHFADSLLKSVSLTIRPNPTSGKLYLTFTEQVPTISCELINLHGDVVWDKHLDGWRKDYELDVSQEPTGTYILRVEAMGLIFQKKVVLIP